MMDLRKATERCVSYLALARAFVHKKAPYIAKTLYGLVPHAAPGVGTMGVTAGLVLYYDPVWMISDPELSLYLARTDAQRDNALACLAGCLRHECAHPIRGMDRIDALRQREVILFGNAKNDVANIAADLAINCTLVTAQWVLPSWVYLPERFGFEDNKTMEVYFDLLIQLPKKKREKLSGIGGGGGGEKKGKGAGDSDSDDGEEGSGKSGRKGAGPGSGCCGGIAGNQSRAEFERKLDEEIGRHSTDIDVIRKGTLGDIKSHIERHGRGSVPGHSVESLTFEKKKPMVDWRRQVQRVVRRMTGRVTAGGSDYSIQRPSRRSGLLGVVRPGLVEQKVEFAFARDTSASMGTEQINDANNEIIGAMRRMGVDEVWLIDADTQVQGKPRRVSFQDIPRIPAKGRGGTNFINTFDVVKKLRPRPDILIYMTDGDGQAPPRAPAGMAVIWCIVPTPYGCKPADWGTIIICTNDQELREPYAA